MLCLHLSNVFAIVIDRIIGLGSIIFRAKMIREFKLFKYNSNFKQEAGWMGRELMFDRKEITFVC